MTLALALALSTLGTPLADAAESSSEYVKPGEVRGIWVTRWSYKTSAEVDRILDDCKRAGATHVFFQVRGRFDAFYKSEIEPWAEELTGTLGKDPGWDPLEVAVEGAHARGMQLHPWLNTYSMWSDANAPASAGIPHALAAHPEWASRDAGGRGVAKGDKYLFASPGHPEVRAHIARVVDDIDARYDVDGIHLDYLRYAGPGYDHNPVALAAWAEQGERGEWQRHQVTQLVREVQERVDVPVSAAVWGIHRDAWEWGRVTEGYSTYYQDARAMLADGTLDAAAPMTYWAVSETPGSRLDFAALVADHVAGKGKGKIWSGIAAHTLTWPQIEECVRVSRAAGADGFLFFDYTSLRDKGYIDELSRLRDSPGP